MNLGFWVRLCLYNNYTVLSLFYTCHSVHFTSWSVTPYSIPSYPILSYPILFYSILLYSIPRNVLHSLPLCVAILPLLSDYTRILYFYFTIQLYARLCMFYTLSLYVISRHIFGNFCILRHRGLHFPPITHTSLVRPPKRTLYSLCFGSKLVTFLLN